MGIPDGQYHLARALRWASGVFRDEYEAARLFKLAAEAGHGLAQNNYGVMLEQGRGLVRNIPEVIRYYKMSSDSACPTGMFNLADMLIVVGGIALLGHIMYSWISRPELSELPDATDAEETVAQRPAPRPQNDAEQRERARSEARSVPPPERKFSIPKTASKPMSTRSVDVFLDDKELTETRILEEFDIERRMSQYDDDNLGE
jgi:hypothetical protein